MIALNLCATGKEQTILKDYLESSASEVLADKINNGVRIEKDGKTLISKKTLETFLAYACEEARKQAEKGARAACVKSDTVFGWAIHYFHEDSIEGTLYNEDGTEFKAKPVARANPAKPIAPAVTAPPKPKPQVSMFDLFNSEPQTEQTAVAARLPEQPEIDEPEEDYEDEAQTGAEEERPKLTQISETKCVDNDGVIYEADDKPDAELKALFNILGGAIIVR